MRKKKVLLTAAAVVLIFLLLLVLFSPGRTAVSAKPAVSEVYYEEEYEAYLKKHGYDGTLAQEEAAADLSKYETDGGLEAYPGEEGIVTGDTGSITFFVTAGNAGFYHLELGYIAQPGTTSDIQRKLYINGELCYPGLDQIVLKRFYQDDEIKVKNGNETRPNTSEIFKETKVFLEDYNRRSGEPYLFWLEEGTNRVTFEVIKEPVEYTSLVFKAQKKPDSYQTVIGGLLQKYPVYKGETIICQAERAEGGTVRIEKNSSSVNIQKNYSDSMLVPYHPYKIIYNTIGADSYKQPGSAVTWTVEVPEEGLYELTFKGRQSLKRGVTSYRRISVNGEVPYAEMNAVGFSYQGKMTNYTAADENGEPYLFYLRKGENTISLECVMGAMGEVIGEVEISMYNLNQIYLKTVKLTGQVPDKFIDYEVSKKVPEFAEVMEQESERLFRMVDRLVELTGEKGENTTLLEKMALEAQKLAKKPESVTEEITQLKNNISALGTWLVNISEMPLELDSLLLGGQGAELPKAAQGTLRGAFYGTVRFFSTFFVDNSQVSGETGAADNGIKVWMVGNAAAAGANSSGREQAQIIQNLIDEVFTPQTGIPVNLQLIPVDVVLRAALAGSSPDVVIGLSQTTLQDFAMRNAVVNLKELEGFEEASAGFYESTIDAASYLDGVYGLPEQANFMMLFVRDDILQQIGASVPETWDEVKELLPVLQKNNYSFCLPTAKSGPNLITSMIFQYGGDLYEGDGNRYGEKSALSSEEAMLAFKDYTDLFTSYGLPVQVDFANRFRTGEIPIGIASYTTYNTLEIFAPEIKGLWSFHTLPGIEQADGSVNHVYAIDTVQSTIMQSSDNQTDAWEFLKWWTGTETQLSYANTVESIMGTAARYSAADPAVVAELPWSNRELAELTAQFEETVGIPAVPGSYMSARMVQYAFDQVVAELANPRETLYLNVKDIDKELEKKWREFR